MANDVSPGFIDQIAALARAGEPDADGEAYVAAFREFALGLRAAGVGAEVRPSSDPRRSWLYVHAADRPAQGSLMLSLTLDGHAAVVNGDPPQRFETAEALRAWLLRFVKLPGFQESLATLREVAAAPVEGRLRTKVGAYSRDDVVVEISAAAQHTLFAARPEDEVKLTATRLDRGRNPAIGKVARYKELDSGGVTAAIRAISGAGNERTLTVVKASRRR